MDDARMIAAAKRKARRTAHTTGTTHQQALDAVARDLGREHWGAFLENPVEVPRDGPRFPRAANGADEGLLDMLTALAVKRGLALRVQRQGRTFAVRLGDESQPMHVGDISQYDALHAMIVDRARATLSPDGSGRGAYRQEVGGAMIDFRVAFTEVHGVVGTIKVHQHGRHFVELTEDAGDVQRDYVLGGVEWNLPEAARHHHFQGLPFVPSWNALTAAAVSEGGRAREEHVEAIVSLLMPPGREAGLVSKARRALEGFLTLEIDRAAQEHRKPSIPAMIDWIKEGLRWASPRAGDIGVDLVARWMVYVAGAVQDESILEYVAMRLSPLADMMANERGGVLGTVDKALLPFANRQVRAINA